MFKLFIASLKILTRDRGLLFWSLMFPLMFTFIFGFFFGKGSSNAGTVILINNSTSQIAQTFEKTITDSGLFKVQKETDSAKSETLLKNGQAAAIVSVPQDFGAAVTNAPTQIKVTYDPATSQQNSIVLGFVSSFLTNTNFQINHINPTFSVLEDKTNTHILSYFDFVLVGLIGMALMNSSVQGIAIGMSKYREDKILKRITTTPLPSWKFIVAFVLSRLVLNVVQVVLIVSIGVYFFKAHIYGSYLLIFLFAMLGAILFQLIGFAIAGAVKTTEAAEGMATAVTIPMMFLAGVFFPIDQLPKWLYFFVQYLPLAPLLRMMRQIALESNSPLTNPVNLIIVGVWILVMLILAAYKFRLNEE